MRETAKMSKDCMQFCTKGAKLAKKMWLQFRRRLSGRNANQVENATRELIGEVRDCLLICSDLRDHLSKCSAGISLEMHWN